MSRYLTQKEDGTYLEEIESMDICKWNIDDVCGCFKKEDGIIKLQSNKQS